MMFLFQIKLSKKQGEHSVPVVKKDTDKNEWFTTPSLIKKPLVGLKIIDVESQATKLSEKNVNQIKTKYAEFVVQTLKILDRGGFKEPKNAEELKDLCSKISLIVGKSFRLEPTDLLCEGLNKKSPTLDCDTGSFVEADILNQFGVKSKIVTFSDHAILHVQIKDISLYPTFADTEKEFENMFRGMIHTECDFQAANPITYFACGTKKEELGDRNGAIAFYSKAIEINPKDRSPYINRGNIKLDLGDRKGAIEDFKKADELSILPDVYAAYQSLKKGDIVLYSLSDGSKYIGKYLGNGPYTGKWLDKYYKKSIIINPAGTYRPSYNYNLIAFASLEKITPSAYLRIKDRDGNETIATFKELDLRGMLEDKLIIIKPGGTTAELNANLKKLGLSVKSITKREYDEYKAQKKEY